ncbi:MAG: hypothetical protein AXA67_12910 [Methylothermaceae bacteria B42]|nr:MAG: hypothetical protein AXA67_12910 [Methylothermaceae bacteria B42]HHJ38476.1 hypothetical protein [Methylothermaceae bacterium]
MLKHTKYITALGLMTWAFNSNAVVLSLDPARQIAQAGDEITLDVLYDTEGKSTVGGGFSIKFDDTAFDLQKVAFDDNLPDDPGFRVSPDLSQKSDTFNLGFGNFSGIQGSGKAITLFFQALKPGEFNFILGKPLPPEDPFKEPVSFNNATVTVQAVPIPAAIGLFASGLVGIGLKLRRKLT